MPVELNIPKVTVDERREIPLRGRVVLLPGKGVLTLGSTALGVAAAITYNPGDVFQVTGGRTNPACPRMAESTFIELVARQVDPSLPPGVFNHENEAKNSWENIEKSRLRIENLMKTVGASELTIIATRPHSVRFVDICRDEGITHAINLLTIEDLLGNYSVESQAFLEEYMQSREYKREAGLELIYNVYHKAHLPDSPLRFVSGRRG